MAQTKTLADLKTYAKRINSDREDDKSVAQNLRAIQNAIRNTSMASDWTFLRERTRISTTAQYTTGAINITRHTATVTGTSNASNVAASFPTSIETSGATWAMKPAGEKIDYDISARNGSSTLTMASVYIGTTNISAGSFILFRRSYDLPANLRELIAIVDVRYPERSLKRISHKQMLEQSLQRSDGSQPLCYSVENKTSDAVRQLWLHPFPNGTTRFQYDLIYQRWPDNPTADTDTIDWPDDLMPVLEAAIAVEIALENEDMERYGLFQADLANKMREAMRGDVDESASFYVGGHGQNARRRWPFHLTVNGDST